jgi:hypothetical protein
MNRLDLDELRSLVIDLKVLESSDILDNVGVYLTSKEAIRVARLKIKEDIVSIERKIMNLLKQSF